jgi:uncharacterized protein (DUF885 family)
MSREAFHALSEEFVSTSFRLDPITATLAGVHDYDAELGDPSRGAVRRRTEWLREMTRRLETEVDRAVLSPSEEIDCRLLESRLRAGRIVWETQQEAERNPVQYPDTCLYGAYLVFMREFAPLSERLDPLLGRLERTRPYLRMAQETLGDCPALFIELAAEVADSGAEFVDDVRGALRVSLHDEIDRIDAACDEARAGFEEFSHWLREEKMKEAKGAFPIGREAFDARLREEHLLPYDADALEKVGWDVLRATQEEMKTLAERIAPGRSWHELIAETKRQHPSPERLLDVYRDEMRNVREFVVSKRLAPMPDGEELEIVETPPFDRSRTPYAAYLMPGAFDAVQRGYFYVTPVDLTKPREEQEEQLQGHNSYSIPLVALHEAYPGHHQQCCWANKANSSLRKLADSAVLAEGWALYCEELFHEQGYYTEPLTRLYQLKDLAWRAARVVLDCRLHTGQMSFDEAVEFLVREPMLERPNAIAEVKRYTLTPTQPMSYVVGKQELLGLREEVRRRLGERFDLHDFHAAVLLAGAMPVSLVRDEVMQRLGLRSA